MSEDNKAGGPSEPEAGHKFRAVPDGYRQGLITAITVLLGFSLSFLRFWGFEAPGEWTLRSVISTGTTWQLSCCSSFHCSGRCGWKTATQSNIKGRSGGSSVP